MNGTAHVNLTRVPGVGQLPPAVGGQVQGGWRPLRGPPAPISLVTSETLASGFLSGPSLLSAVEQKLVGSTLGSLVQASESRPVAPTQDLTAGVFEDNLRSLNLQEGRDFLHFS